ncbi:unnamed protein product [Lathyrus sativus]|nr:unnamed protein product [Lathyrus sativus]
MESKVLVSAVSLILVVGVALGVVALVRTNQPGESAGGGELNAHTKAVQAVCQNTDDKKLCVDTLNPVNTSDPNDYIKAVVKTSLESVFKALNMSDRLIIEHAKKEEPTKMALEDCKDLLQFAIDELEASTMSVNEGHGQNPNDRAADLKNWLGAVIAYQQSCLDGFETDGEKKIQADLKVGSLDQVEKLTALALDIVTAVSKILASLNLDLNVQPSHRRLFEVDSDGYPEWMSGPDRKLLADMRTGGPVTPNVVVAKDGSGQFKTVLEAINSYPKKHVGRYVIYVKAGVYDEYVQIDKKKPKIMIYGDGPTKTIITGKKNNVDGWKTMRSATFSTVAEDFIAKSIAFENTAGPAKHQAVALRVQGDRSALYDCAMHGYQDTLYAHAHRQFYRNCEISGTVDFIFGYGSTLIQNSKIIVRRPGPTQQNIVVADGTVQKNMPTGVVLQNCEIMPEPGLQADRLKVQSFLARPWKPYARAIFMENVIGDLIQPVGFIPWGNNQFTENCYFAEYANTGPGADVKARAKWGKGVLSKADAMKYTADQWLKGGLWLPATGIPFELGFTKP